ncbi:hypothetical protein HTZ84_05230 [Haloterrigena sp. SYSU A558-1]|uniref:Uncharacterized protein n=1 Tax=Haloterrigena gelatinilytica TaxID=2741724 RepID=A0ABX2LG63_9EURY|nr:hypothetical protein [Haloterrigena gelatinilytica]NUC71716.1 hypothetical protein [Haloterrigena gelatinilytica]
MHEYQIGHAHTALTQNQNRRATRGDGVLEGCQVSAGDSSSSVETEVDGGYVQIDGNVLEFAPTAVTHPDGSGDPRRDVVLVQDAGDGTGEVFVQEGDPGSWPTDDSGNEYRHANAWQPQPPDTASSDAVVLAIVSIGPNATQSSGISDVEDRRREPAPSGRQGWQQPNITTPTVNLESGDFYAQPLAIPGDSWLHVWSVAQYRFLEGSRASWDSNWELSIMEPGDLDTAAQSTIAESEFVGGDPVWQISIGGSPNEIQPYWIQLHNTGSSDMDNEEYWSAQLAVTVDRRPI